MWNALTGAKTIIPLDKVPETSHVALKEPRERVFASIQRFGRFELVSRLPAKSGVRKPANTETWPTAQVLATIRDKPRLSLMAQELTLWGKQIFTQGLKGWEPDPHTKRRSEL